MHYDVILWDADGVTLDAARRFSTQLQADYGINTELMQPFFKGVFKDCSIGKADLRVELAKVMGDWGWTGTLDELLDYWFTQGTAINNEVVEYIGHIRDQGTRCFMVTDQEKYRGQYLANKLGNGHPFEHVFYSGEIGALKVDAAYFAFVYDAIGRPTKDRVLLIEDDEKNIAAGQAFGFATHFFHDLNTLKNVLA